MGNFRDTPVGIVRINAGEFSTKFLIYPKLHGFLAEHPHIRVELHIDNRMVDIVEQGFDMGVRLGEDVRRDMIAIPLSPPMTMLLVASADYLTRHPAPQTVTTPARHRRTVGAETGGRQCAALPAARPASAEPQRHTGGAGWHGHRMGARTFRG